MEGTESNRDAYGADDGCTWHERANDATSELAVEAMHLAEVPIATGGQVLQARGDWLTEPFRQAHIHHMHPIDANDY